MLKEEIIIKLNNRDIIEKTSSKFGNGAHVVISRKYLGKKVKILAGKSKIFGKNIKIDFSKSEILERKASRFGTGCHIIIPKEYAGKKIKIIIEKSKGDKKWMN